MKLHNNYEATQAVLKSLTKKVGKKWMMEDAVKEGIEMGVVSPRTPSSKMLEYANATPTKVPTYNVAPILELIEKLGDFSMLPLYKKKAGKFEHVALEVTKNENVSEISELSYNQMNYLASVRPSAMKRFFSDYALMLENYRNMKDKVAELQVVLKMVQNEFSAELASPEYEDLSGMISKEVGNR